MALSAVTSLAAAISANSLVANVTSATGAVVGGFIKMDDEYAEILAINGTSIGMRNRGCQGGSAVAHVSLATVSYGLFSDIPTPSPGFSFTEAAHPGGQDVFSISADGAINVPAIVRNSRVHIRKATAAAVTLAGPTVAQDGLELEIISDTAAAHTVTYTAGIYADTTSSDVLTFAAKAGASVTLKASGGRWGAKALANVTAA